MRATDFVESYFDAWNQQDSKGVADHLTADGIYCDIPENEQRSHDELIANPNNFFSEYVHRYELIGEVLASNDTIAFQYRIFPNEKIGKEASAKPYLGAEFMTINGDAAMIITDYYDQPGRNGASNLAGMESCETEKRKYAKSGLDREQLIAYKYRLENIMRSKQLFLRADLTLPKLAEAVDCSINHLSQVINGGFDMSFFDYLNRYRIQYAQELLARCDGQSTAILNIAFTVGFNSNSAFYSAFKKRVGKTPAQYRRLQLNRQN